MDSIDHLEGCNMLAVSPAIKNKATGEITLGLHHMAARVISFRFETGSRKSYKALVTKDVKKGDEDFIKYLEENEFEDGFINSNLEFLSRAKATQIIMGHKHKPDQSVLLLSNQEIMKGAVKSGARKTD